MAHASAASETRTLHALAFPARLPDPGVAERRRGLYVDCETTGFSPEHDAVIELALLPFTYTLAGTVVEVLHDEAQAHRNDPGRPLPAEITHLTGLTDDDVRGEVIDVEAASALIERSGLIVAHNARFDRPFVERVLPAARAGPGRARARRFRGPRRGSRARRCTVSFAPTGSTPGTGTARSRTARRGCGCSRSASRSRATPSSRRCAGGRSPRRCACGRFARRSRRRRRFARGATGGCRKCVTESSVRGGPTSSPMGWRASSRGFARRSMGGRGGTCPPGGSPSGA